MTFQSTRFQVPTAVCAVVMLAAFTAGCGGSESGVGGPSNTTLVPQTDQPVEVSVQGPLEVAGPDTSEIDEGADNATMGDEAGSSETMVDDPDPDGGEAHGNSDTGSAYDELAALEAALEGSEDVNGVPSVPTEGTDAYLGGSPDAYSAAAITLGLEEAGVELTGITLSVLPIGGMDASLLVLEVGDAYFDPGFLTEAKGADITGALLALPEIGTASIAELVTIYRGVDEEGPFSMTFAVSIDALREASVTGGELGDALVVQVDRRS